MLSQYLLPLFWHLLRGYRLGQELVVVHLIIRQSGFFERATSVHAMDNIGRNAYQYPGIKDARWVICEERDEQEEQGEQEIDRSDERSRGSECD